MAARRLFGNNQHGRLIVKHITLISPGGFHPQVFKPLLVALEMLRHVVVERGRPDGQQFVVALLAEFVGTVVTHVSVDGEKIAETVGDTAVPRQHVVQIVRDGRCILPQPGS